MKSLLVSFLIILLNLHVNGQVESSSSNDSLDVEASFPGGEVELKNT